MFMITDDTGVPGWKFTGWSNNVECIVQGQTEDLVKKGGPFIALPLRVINLLAWCHPMLPFQTPMQEMVNLKEMIN